MSSADLGDQIIVTLDVMLARRGMSLAELARRVDITSANASILKNGHARAVRFSTLAAICRELECQPGDVLSYRRGDDHGGSFRRGGGPPDGVGGGREGD